MILGMSEFRWMVDHEILLAQRYQRFVSLALMKSLNGEKVLDVVGNVIRQSDAYFEFSDTTGAILMSETDAVGCQVAMQRYMRQCDEAVDIRCAIGTYPQNNLAVPGFLANLFEQLDRASVLPHRGAVVTMCDPSNNA